MARSLRGNGEVANRSAVYNRTAETLKIRNKHTRGRGGKTILERLATTFLLQGRRGARGPYEQQPLAARENIADGHRPSLRE